MTRRSIPSASGNTAAGTLPKVAWGKGIHVYDTTGKRYVDASGGPAAFCLGHGNDEVNEAIIRQIQRIAHGYRYSFTSDPLEQLREIVSTACGASLEHMVFVSSGSEAVESALKIALQYHSARGEASRRHFISRRRSWHGNTLGALSVSDFLERRIAFEGALIPATFVSSANLYRPPAGIRPEDVGNYCVAELEAQILKLGARNVAAFIFEPVVGAAGGVVPAPDGYSHGIRELCDRYGILMIADEVMCGSGRCGTWRALEHDGVVPDIMAIAKGLGGGYVPIGAAVYRDRIAEVLIARDGGPQTGHTFTGHTTACAAAVAVQTIMKRDGLLQRMRNDGPRFMKLLVDEFRDVEAIGDIRGRGFFWGIEFVADRATRTPFDPTLQLANRVGHSGVQRGLLCYPSTGNVDGVSGDTIILAPPYNSSMSELEEIVKLFGQSVRDALAEVMVSSPAPPC